MNITNDHYSSWINQLNSRNFIDKIKSDCKSDFLIIGAGYTGLSAARKLGYLNPQKKIILVDAQLAGEGASGRNSGYLVDTTLNDGFTSNKNLKSYEKKSKLYQEGIKAVKNFIKEYQVDCDWNHTGKFFASSNLSDKKILDNFSSLLTKLNFDNEIFFDKDLKKKLGTGFYKIGLYTKGGILLNPGKLVRAMVETLPENVSLYENTQLLKWNKNNNIIESEFKDFKIISKKIIFCTNGFLRSLGIKKKYNFPLTLTASMTRQLTNSEYEDMGKPKEWGVLPVRAMGATVRMTKDKRILIRNTAELHSPEKMSERSLIQRKKIHQLGLLKRFPKLPNNIIESTWSGVVCRSGNGSQIFDQIDQNIYVAGCYNGSGIGLGTLFGEQIAIKASGEHTNQINLIQNANKPNYLPPDPFLGIGIRTRLLYERFKANSEI